ncbi:Retrovirus-related Pol polyprotein from transposon RE1 (Retro element 1) (AtRE1) [Includes: Protease RE1 [Durusdinium trenchii]|uniref:Retrovirus-related Pol polyprotein from transposon RE1 (Retro element 1) (AtRE1) n=2 Tax=Durusdinium trenchii TaxID=1381693 RepID=A0ABP0JE19_9DINO
MRWLRALAEKAAVVRLSSRSGGFDLLPKLVAEPLCSWLLGRRAHTHATTALTPSITRAAAWHLPVAWFRSFKVAAFLVFFLVWFGPPSCLTTSVSLSTSSRRVPPPSLAMTTVTAKDVYVSWNGDLNTWPDFVRKVRLQYEKTQPSKRYLLGPELVSRLTDKAWQASYEIDHDRLSGRHGVKYMLSFLRDKLCRAPVPDAGARLEDLLIRLRRQRGTPFAQWAHEVREHYRRLQRALLRARQEAQPKETSMKKSSKGNSKKSHGSTATEPEPRPSSTGSDHSPSRSVRSREPAIPEDEEQEEEEGEEDEVDDGSPSNRGGWNTWWQWGNQWTAEEWNEWLGKKKKHDGSDSWSAYAEDDEDMNEEETYWGSASWDDGGGSAHYVDVLYAVLENDTYTTNEYDSSVFMAQDDSMDAEETISAWTVQPSDDQFHAVIDCGATETVASLHALTAIMNRRQSKFGYEEIRVNQDVRKTFKFGNGRTLQATSYVETPQSIGGTHTWLGVHALDTDDRYVPLLLGMRTLERLAAVIDFGSKTASFCAVSDELVLGSSLKFARARTRGFHTIAMSGTPSTTRSQPETPKKVTAKGKSKGQKNQKLPDDQIYDFARKEGPDPRDPRFKGGPCKGQHVEAPFGRGSPSGKNGWAMWKTCQNCMLRLEYIPAYGAHAKYRSAGPLSADTKDQLIEKDPSVLRTAEVALDGAERSLHRRLETIQKQKEALKKDKTKDECRGTGSSSGGVGRLLDRDASDGCELTTPESVKCLVAETMNDTTTAINDSLHEFVNLSFDSMPGVVLFSPEARSLDLLEVCCPPDSALAAMVERLGGSSARVTENNMNLNSVDGLTQAISFVRREKPRWMWLSLPCGANSPIQHLNELTEQAWLKSLARRKKSRKLVRRALQLLRVHVFENGGHFGWEWPKTNDGWHQKELKDFLKEVHEKKQNLFRTLLHGCQVGVVNDKNEPVLKPWTIYVTDRAMASALHLVCPHDHQRGEAMGGQSAKKTGFYPPRMARIIARQILRRDLPPHVEPVQEKDEEALLAYGVSEIETVVPDGVSPVEWKRVLALVKRLHVRAGHPSTRSLVATLKARGAHPLITLAAKYMHCDDCAETKRSVPAARASFNRSDTQWHTLQVDNAYFKVGTKTVTAMIMVDEASTFMVPHLLHRLDEGEHENATAEQVVDALQNSWIRFFGHPSVLRLDPEGAFRSRLLEDFCGTRDIELQPCAAEAHYQIGVVERAIGTLRKSVERFLRSNAVDPWEAIVTMCAAHNEVGKIAGFSPAQWALGRSLGIDEKIHESGREATSFHESQRASQDRVQKTMVLRLKAEQEYKKNMAQEAINRAWNSKAQKREIWTPGTLVYYKRYKAPSTSLASHKDVDVTRRQIARWYGPGRVVATESFLDGDSARPGHIVWITAGGRLKRVAPEQLRLASETEKILAEADGPPRFDWTIQGMLQEVDRGQFDVYDDLLQPSPATPARRSRSAAPPVRDFSPGRYLSDPSCEFPTSHGAAGKSWTGELKRNELFKKAQERHGEAKMVEETSFACESLQPEDDQGEPPLFVAMSLELPTDERSMKQFKRDPVTWTANKLKKHVEVKMEHLTPEQVEDMKKAKSLEGGQWIQAAACKALEEHQIAPRSRTMRMRWVLTFKSSGAAKARIVIVGFSDPDLGSLSTTSPLMSRRTRQLMMTMASCCGWSQVKCDAKSAFLQTSENTEEHRSVFAVPVPELAMAMGVEPGRAVQVVKSCYGLCNAPHQWYLEVRNKILELGGEALKTEPCCWRIKDPSTNSVVGLVGSHVDDFYMIGDDGNETWNLFLHRFKASYRWSPWECDSFDHCGVQLHQTPSKEIILDHAKFCTGIQQISITTKDPKAPATPQEVEQLRAVLVAAQWRVVQSGPQHGAKLSQLQSRVTKADGQTLAEANKLVREIYNDRTLSPKTQVLECSPEEVEFVAWSDAALANRVDMGSTGGYVVGATTKDLREGKKARVNFVGWKTFKLKRIARSSLAAEVQAFSEAEEELMFTRLQWGEMLGHDLDPRSPEDVLVRVPGILVTDAKSLYDSVQKGLVNTSGLGLSEKYSALELLSVMERLDRGHTETRWVNSDAQLADALTKHQCQSSLHQALVQGHWILVYDPLFVSAKKRKAAKLGPKA